MNRSFKGCAAVAVVDAGAAVTVVDAGAAVTVADAEPPVKAFNLMSVKMMYIDLYKGVCEHVILIVYIK